MSGITRRGLVKGATLASLALTPLTAMAQRAAEPDRFDIVSTNAGENTHSSRLNFQERDLVTWKMDRRSA